MDGNISEEYSPSSEPPPPTRLGVGVVGRQEPSLEGGVLSRSVCHAPSITHSLTLAAGLNQVISGGYKLALHYSPGARLSLPFTHASLSSYSPAYDPGFPILPVPDSDSCLALLDPHSPVSCPGFPILPVPDYDSCLILLDLRSPVSCSGFPILPVTDSELRLGPPELCSPASGPGSPIPPVHCDY